MRSHLLDIEALDIMICQSLTRYISGCLQELKLADTKTVKYSNIPLSVTFQSFPDNTVFPLRSQVENNLHSGWSD